MTNNCFENNQIGLAVVGVYGGDNLFAANYGSSSNGDVCAFVSNFETDDQFDANMPRCSTFELSGTGATCQADVPAGPTFAPTAMPSSIPSMVPTDTASPTGSSESPTLAPVASPVAPVPNAVPAPDGAGPGSVLTPPPSFPPIPVGGDFPAASTSRSLHSLWLLGAVLCIWL